MASRKQGSEGTSAWGGSGDLVRWPPLVLELLPSKRKPDLLIPSKEELQWPQVKPLTSTQPEVQLDSGAHACHSSYLGG